MPTITSTTTGLWSAGSTWVGGVKPTTDDDVVIAAGHVVTVDESTAVVNSVLVKSDASTPATLRWMDGYSGTLNIKSGAVATNKLYGDNTSATCRGRILVNESGLWTGSTASTTLMASQLGTSGTVTDGGGSKRIFTPGSSPAWVVDALIGESITINGTTYAIEDNDATTATLTTGPAIGATVTSWELVVRPLPVDHRAIIALGALSQVQTQYLDVLMYCKEPTTQCLRTYGTSETFTADSGTEYITLASTLTVILTTNTPVYVHSSGTLPGGLSAGTLYYVRSVSGATCKLSTTASDTGLVDITSAGTGTHVITTGMVEVSSIASNTITTAVSSLPSTPWANAAAVMFTSTGTYPSGIEADRMYFIKSLSGGTFKLAAYSDATNMPELTLGTTWTGTLKAYLGSAATTQATVAVLDDVSADTAWEATGDTSTFATCTSLSAAVLADEGPTSYDQQRVAVKTIAPTFVVLSAAVDSSQYPNSRLWLASRNVEIRSEAVAQGTAIVSALNSTGGVWGCAIRSRVGTGSTFYGTGVDYGSQQLIKGVISGTYYGINNATSNTVAGIICACYYGVWAYYASTPTTVSGTICGCSDGVYLCTGVTVSGTIAGCNSGFNNVSSPVLTGTIRGCNTGITACRAMRMSGTIASCLQGITGTVGTRFTGTIRGCSSGISTPNATEIDGAISGCVYGVNHSQSVIAGSALLRDGCELSGNFRDVLGPFTARGYGAKHLSTMQVANYKFVDALTNDPAVVYIVYDLPSGAGAAQPGYIGAWNGGGYTKTEAWSSGTHGTPPRIPPAGIHVTTCQDDRVKHMVEFPLRGNLTRPVRVIVCAKQPVDSVMDDIAVFSIDDARKDFEDGSRSLTSWTMTNNTNWQMAVLSYQATYERDLLFRLVVRGGNSSGSGSDALWWFQIFEDEDTSRPRNRVKPL